MKKTWVFIIAAFFISGMLSGCAVITGRTAGTIVDDSTITAQANALIIKDPELHYLKINVDTNEGNVVLTGFIPNKNSEERLIQQIREIRGVKSVKSLLRIEGPKN